MFFNLPEMPPVIGKYLRNELLAFFKMMEFLFGDDSLYRSQVYQIGKKLTGTTFSQTTKKCKVLGNTLVLSLSQNHFDP